MQNWEGGFAWGMSSYACDYGRRASLLRSTWRRVKRPPLRRSRKRRRRKRLLRKSRKRLRLKLFLPVSFICFSCRFLSSYSIYCSSWTSFVSKSQFYQNNVFSYLRERGSETLLGSSLSLQCNYIQHFQNSLFESFFYLLMSICFREIFNKKQMNYSQKLDIRMEMASKLLV